MTTARDIRKQVSQYSVMLHERAWVANHDGNVSARDPSKGFWITPTAVSKRVCDPQSIVHCSDDGKPISSGRPPSEVALHLGAYASRPEAKAVIHAHPPYASAFALARRSLGPVAMPEVVVSLGPEIPLAPLVLPKAPEAADIVAAELAKADAILLTGNGVLAIGVDLEQAFLRVELLEHYARIVSISESIGGVQALDSGSMQKMLELRKKAGLGPKTHEAPVRTESQAASSATISAIRPIVAEEIRRVLGGNK